MAKFWTSTSSTSFSTAANWSDGVAPANGDTLIFNHLGTANCTTDLSTILTGITLIVEKTYTGQIGVLSGSTATYLVLDGGTAHIGQSTGQGSPSGSTLVMLNFGTTAATVNIYDSSSSSSSTYYPPVIVKGTVLTVNQTGGSAAIAPLPGEVSTGTFRVTKGAGSIEPSLYLGAGVTVTRLDQNAGNVLSRSDQTATLVEKSGGTYRYSGTGATTTLNNYGGTVYSEGTGAITTLRNGATVDFTRDPRAKTVTNCEAYEGSTFDLRTGSPTGTPFSVTFTNGIDLVRCGTGDVTLRTDPHATLSFTAV